MRLPICGIVAGAALSLSAATHPHAAATGMYSAKATVSSTSADTTIGPLNASVGAEASGFSGALNFESELDARLELRTRLYPDPAQSVPYPLNATLEFRDLNLFDDGLALVVTGAVFNENKSNDDFDFWPEFIVPTVSIADNTLTIETGYRTARMAGDQPDLYFDLETVVVPIPAALPLLGTALAALGIVGCRPKFRVNLAGKRRRFRDVGSASTQTAWRRPGTRR